MKHKNKAEHEQELEQQNQEEVLQFNPEMPQEEENVEYPESVSVEQYNALYDQFVRVQADFENFKRRNAMTASTMYMNGINDMIEEILPVLDYLDMAIDAQKDEEQRKGIELVKNAFLEALKKHGVVEMVCLGQEFDPNMHDAVAKVTDGENSGKVVEVVKKGYHKEGKILRHAMVVVAE